MIIQENIFSKVVSKKSLLDDSGFLSGLRSPSLHERLKSMPNGNRLLWDTNRLCVV